MRRIIAACALTLLTACDAAPRPDAAPGPNSPPASDAGTRRDAPATTSSTGDERRNIVFMGTSLTAGYGVGAEVAFPAVIQQKIDAAGLPFHVVNAGISGETSAGGLRRLDWALTQPVDVLVLELGANDGLRGIDPSEMRRNLDAILTRTRERYPDAALVLVGMEAPPNLGDTYTDRFRAAFTDLARQHDATLVPFLLEGVAADPALNIEDGIHPNPRGHQILANTVWRTLKPLLERRAATTG